MNVYDVEAVFIIEADNPDEAQRKLQDILEEYIPQEYPCQQWGIPRLADI